TLQHYFTDSQYRMVENAAEVKDFLSISGKLSLKIKAGMVDVSGEGSYVKDSSSKTNGIEILVKVHFETRNATYGGDLIASIRISSSNTYDLMRIKAAINGGLNVGGGSFPGNIDGNVFFLGWDFKTWEFKGSDKISIRQLPTLTGLKKQGDSKNSTFHQISSSLARGSSDHQRQPHKRRGSFQGECLDDGSLALRIKRISSGLNVGGGSRSRELSMAMKSSRMSFKIQGDSKEFR
ncbi:hypothetical protein AVEN_7487-1, partial [Araneus ventricosus]